jgi:hypothetical protein
MLDVMELVGSPQPISVTQFNSFVTFPPESFLTGRAVSFTTELTSL